MLFYTIIIIKYSSIYRNDMIFLNTLSVYFLTANIFQLRCYLRGKVDKSCLYCNFFNETIVCIIKMNCCVYS